jgi:hypothetical protein
MREPRGQAGGYYVEASLNMRSCLDASGYPQSAWSQAKSDAPSPVPASFTFPPGVEVTFQWNYTCRTGKPCAFTCGATNNVKTLTLYMGTIPVGNNQRNPIIFYFYSTATVPQNDGFQISGGPASTLSCNVSGMTLDYSGAPIGIPAPNAAVGSAR